MDQTIAVKVKVLATKNAELRMREIGELDFEVSAKADYYNGLVQGFIDGAKWAFLERLTVQEILNLLDKVVVGDYIQGLLNTHRGIEIAENLTEIEQIQVYKEQ